MLEGTKNRKSSKMSRIIFTVGVVALFTAGCGGSPSQEVVKPAPQQTDIVKPEPQQMEVAKEKTAPFDPVKSFQEEVIDLINKRGEEGLDCISKLLLSNEYRHEKETGKVIDFDVSKTDSLTAPYTGWIQVQAARYVGPDYTTDWKKAITQPLELDENNRQLVGGGLENNRFHYQYKGGEWLVLLTELQDRSFKIREGHPDSFIRSHNLPFPLMTAEECTTNSLDLLIVDGDISDAAKEQIKEWANR